MIGDRVVSSPSSTLAPEKRNDSMVCQSYALWPHMTVAENVAYGLVLRKPGRRAIAEKVKTILSSTQLAALADRYPAVLSGGQQRAPLKSGTREFFLVAGSPSPQQRRA